MWPPWPWLLALGVGENSGAVMGHPPRDAEEPIITRRTWAFPLFEEAQIDTLAEAIRARVSPCPAGA